MAQGTVKWFNESKGFGFITAEDGTDVFVYSQVHRGEWSLRPLLKVTKSALISKKARKVRRLSMSVNCN